MYKTLIVDANNVATRAHSVGNPFSLFNLLMRIYRKYKITHCFFVFDDLTADPTKQQSARQKLYPDYKANREPDPDRTAFCKALYKALSVEGFIPFMARNGLEADDVIATLVEQIRGYGHVYILSADQDLWGLVGREVTVLGGNSFSQIQEITPQYVERKLGIPLRNFYLYKALVGDASDNFKGAPGVGPKTAQTLLSDGAGLTAIAQAKQVRISEDTLREYVALMSPMPTPDVANFMANSVAGGVTFADAAKVLRSRGYPR